MTCIVGLAQDGVVYLGGDSASSDEDSVTISAEPKIYRVGQYLLGDCGTWRAGQVLRYGVKWPTCRATKPETIHRFLYDHVTNAIHEAMSHEDLWKDGEWPGSVMIGIRGTVWAIGGDLGIHWPSSPWWAIGSGALPALGSLHTSRGDPEKRIRTALSAAASLVPSVAPPWSVMWR